MSFSIYKFKNNYSNMENSDFLEIDVLKAEDFEIDWNILDHKIAFEKLIKWLEKNNYEKQVVNLYVYMHQSRSHYYFKQQSFLS